MSQSICLVPWATHSEWLDVKEKILSGDPKCMERAYEILLMWKFRQRSLPAYIECTCGILQVMVQEHKDLERNKHVSNSDYNLQLLYSTALIRFVNHVSSLSPLKSESLYWAAKSQNIPDWIINLRHEAAHGQELPPLDALYQAAELALHWLLENYWITEEEYLDQNPSEPGDDPVMLENKVFPLIIELLKACREGTSKKCVAMLPYENYDILKKIVELWQGSKLKKKRKLVLDDMLKILNKWQLWKHQKVGGVGHKNRSQTPKVNRLHQALLSTAEMFYTTCSTKLVDSLVHSHFLADTPDPQDWEDILLVVLNLGAMPYLIKCLLVALTAGESNQQQGVLYWLGVLPTTMKSLQRKWANYKKLQAENVEHVAEAALRKQAVSMDKKPYPGLVVDLGLHPPPILTLDTLKPVLMQPESCPRKTWFPFLKFVQPTLPATTVTLIKQLVRTYNRKTPLAGNEGSTLEQIYTVDNLKDKTPMEDEEEEECSYMWTKSTISLDVWLKCPLGVPPFKQEPNCEIPADLTWTQSGVGSKRRSLLDTFTMSMKRRKTDMDLPIINGSQNEYISRSDNWTNRHEKINMGFRLFTE